MGKGAGKYGGSRTLSKNIMNFGPQTALNGTGLCAHRHYFVQFRSIALPLIGISVAPHGDS